MNKIHAIPTMYNGLRFRSRLEATWAAFFDQLRWNWEYEPCDFKGWIPDFVLIGAEQNTYVEVKPIPMPAELSVVISTTQKVWESDVDDEVLVCGTNIWKGDDFMFIGWLNEIYDCGDVRSCQLNEAPFGVWEGYKTDLKNHNHLYGFCSINGSYHDRITGCYDGGGWDDGVCVDGHFSEHNLYAMWASAKNITQWNS